MMERTTILLLIGLMIGLLAGSVSGLNNPSQVYCEEMGYEYTTRETSAGTMGYCELPRDKGVYPAWDFLKGKVGKNHSFCVQEGYDIEVVKNSTYCQNIMSNECAVCVNGSRKVDIPTAMNLSFSESVCGDSVCDFEENALSCREDCSTGMADGVCDGVKDGICDPDCEGSMGEPWAENRSDPDCAPDKTTDENVSEPEDDEPVTGNGSDETEPVVNETDDGKDGFPQYTVIGLVIGVVLIAGLIVALFILRGIPREGSAGVNREIDYFVRTSRRVGMSEDTIRSSLKRKGYTDEEIEKYLKE